jgi:hypothetical protein
MKLGEARRRRHGRPAAPALSRVYAHDRRNYSKFSSISLIIKRIFHPLPCWVLSMRTGMAGLWSCPRVYLVASGPGWAAGPDGPLQKPDDGFPSRPAVRIMRIPAREYETAARERWTAARERRTAARQRWMPARERWTAARERWMAVRERWMAARESKKAARERRTAAREDSKRGRERKKAAGMVKTAAGKERNALGSSGIRRGSPGARFFDNRCGVRGTVRRAVLLACCIALRGRPRRPLPPAWRRSAGSW